MIILYIFLAGAVILLLMGFRIVRPTEKGVIETLGKFDRIGMSGLNVIIPFIQNMIYVNITEQMVDVPPQKVITKDNLNAMVDAVVYYKVENVKSALYNVDHYQTQLTSLARTTLRSVIGKMTLTECNEKRDKINADVELVLDKETNSYGVNVLRVEIQKIEAPEDVQDAMNQVVKAEQSKRAAKDLAIATETKADGFRMAVIKEAEGERTASILVAEGEAKALELIGNATKEYFNERAQKLKEYETIAKTFNKAEKVIVPAGSQLINIIGDKLIK